MFFVKLVVLLENHFDFYSHSHKDLTYQFKKYR